MVLERISFQSEDETLLIDISKNDEYSENGGWDVEIKQFPTVGLMGSYNDFSKLINDIRPFVLSLPEEERIAFAELFEKIC